MTPTKEHYEKLQAQFLAGERKEYTQHLRATQQEKDALDALWHAERERVGELATGHLLFKSTFVRALLEDAGFFDDLIAYGKMREVLHGEK